MQRVSSSGSLTWCNVSEVYHCLVVCFFLMINDIQLWIRHILCICSPVNGYLVYFLAAMNNATVNLKSVHELRFLISLG